MADLIKTVLATIILLGAMIGGIVVLNKWANERNEVRCTAAGGEFFRAPDASHSLCKMPGK